MKQKKLLFLSTLGSGLEYFDFTIYALAVSYISQYFFPDQTPLLNNLEVLLIFATGYLCRPVGGLIFGMIGDKYGRKNSFTASILLMGVATLTIGLLPSYHDIGFISPLLLSMARSLQGIAQGAELAGAFTFIYEHESDKKNAPKSLSILNSGVGFGALLGSVFFSILTFTLSQESMRSFGWRIPFIFGGITAFIAYYLRKNTLETPAFLNQQKIISNFYLLSFFKNYIKQIISGVCLVLLPAVLIINFLFLPGLIAMFYHYESKFVFSMQTLGLIWSALLLPIAGKIAVMVGVKKQMKISLLLSTLIIPLSYYVLSFNSGVGLCLFVVLYQTIIAFLASSYSVLLTELFPVCVRYKGVAVSYNLAFAVAGFTPYIFTASADYFHSTMVIPISLMIFGLLGFLVFRLFED